MEVVMSSIYLFGGHLASKIKGAEEFKKDTRSLLNYGEGRKILEQLSQQKITVDEAINLITYKINEINTG
jgi:hypothetical protein